MKLEKIGIWDILKAKLDFIMKFFLGTSVLCLIVLETGNARFFNLFQVMIFIWSIWNLLIVYRKLLKDLFKKKNKKNV